MRAAKELPGATVEVRQNLCAGDGGADVPQPDQDVGYSPYAIKVAASPAVWNPPTGLGAPIEKY